MTHQRSHIWHPFTPLLVNTPLKVRSAKDALLMLENNETLIDCISSWWVITHGHCNPAIAEAVGKQMQTLDHVLFAGFTHAPAEELAELLGPHVPYAKPWFYFSDNGSTAVEVAIKLAWQYWKNRGEKKTTIVAFEGAYHGDTFGSMALSGKSVFTGPFSDLLFEVKRIPLPTEQNIEALLVEWEQICSTGNVAAFIYEPLVQGAAGMKMYSAKHLDRLHTIGHKYKVICIADEVMTGFGRTGKFFATDHMEEVPDIMCLSKGITGGVLPLGLTVMSETLVEAFMMADAEKTFYHGHSFTGNPVSCAAACANIKLFTKETFSAISNIGSLHEAFVQKIKNHPAVTRVENTGTVLAIEIKTDTTGYNSRIRDKIYSYFIKKGLLLRPLGNVMYILPPYCISENQLQQAYNAIEGFLNGEN